MQKQIICHNCGKLASVSKFGPARYCSECRSLKNREQNRASYYRADQRHRERKTYQCNICGKEETSKAGNQRFCSHCRPHYRRATADARYHLNNRVRAGIWASIKGKKNGRKWQELVGYSTSDLMRHLERQFVQGMDWTNIGEWHVDHRVPLASFTYSSPDDPEFRAAWALTNLQPLWAPDNLSKRDRITCLV